MAWTKEQEAAIKHRSGNLLVSASAGSGKTAVLTERVYQILISEKDTPLNSLLVLTFTNYAAQEMRDRIRNKLLDGGYDSLAANVDAVNFQTYDAFALSLVQKYCREIGVPNDVKIVDNTLIEIEKKKQIRHILDDKYEEKDANVINLVNKYCLKNDDKVIETVLKVYNASQLKYDSDAFLDNFVDQYYDESVLKDKLNTIYGDFNKAVKYLISEIGNPDYVEVGKYLTSLREYLLPLVDMHSFNEIASYIASNEKPSSKGARYLEGEKAKSTFFNNEIVGMYFPIFMYKDEDGIFERLSGVKGYAQTIVSLVKELSDRLNSFKKKYNIYTFQDIFKLAIKVVMLPSINKKLRNQFKYIMIDEYQDTSDLQEMFVNLIANDNVFAVGDIKQSIYKFRNANCELFQKKFDKYAKHDGGELIILPENFRSREEVIEDNNKLFQALMTLENTGIEYSKGHVMKHGNKDFSVNFVKEDNYRSECIAYQKESIDEGITAAEYEARLIANDIIRRYNAKTQVMDYKRDDNGNKIPFLRNIKFSDFAILMYAKTNFGIYQKVFNEYQIPLYANYTQTIKENKLTMVINSIFKLISLTKQENYSSEYLHPFVSTLRSFLLKTSDDEIDQLFAGNRTYEEFPLFDKIKELTEYANSHNLEEITKKIFDDFDVYSKLISVGDISDNINLMNYFIKIAKEMDEMNYSVDDYTKYYDELDEFDIEPEYSGGAPDIDSVKLMTIHASKGLQFKYVYYAKLDGQFKHDATGSILFDDFYGLDLPDTNYQSISGVFHKFIAKRAKKETILEQLRVFYVALTRAEEKAILVYKVDFRKNFKENFIESNMYDDFVYISNANYNQYEVMMSDDRPINNSDIDKSLSIDIQDGYKFSKEIKEIKHASKQKSDDANSEALAIGSKYHYYLELVDFSTKDTSFIKDEKDRRRIDRFLSNHLFDDAKEAKVAHEYAFYDEVNEVHGIIDLLMVYKDHIDIIDFKLSHVDDEAYEKQVGVYKDYISQIAGGRDINLYILGILSGEVKKVC